MTQSQRPNIINLGKYRTPVKSNERRHWANLPGSAQSLAIAQTLAQQKKFALVIAADSQTAEQTYNELNFFLSDDQEVLLFPDWETLIYDSFSPHQDIISNRLAILNRLPDLTTGVLVVPATTIMQRIAPRSFTLGNSLLLEIGQKFDIPSMRRKLQSTAYRCVETVLEHGEYAIRGAIMDIFPMGSSLPYRVDLFDDEIETLRTFDTETQLSIDKVNSIKLLPAKEFPFNPEDISKFQDKWHQSFQIDSRNCTVYQDIAQGLSPAGIEYFLPLFYDQLETLFDYLPDNTLIFNSDIETTVEAYWQQAQGRFENLRHDIQRPILPPIDLLISLDSLFAECNKRPRISLVSETTKGDSFDFIDMPDIAIKERQQQPLSQLHTLIEEQSLKVIILAESNGRREVIDEIFSRNGIACTQVEDWQSALATAVSPQVDPDIAGSAKKPHILLAVSPLERGFYLASEKLLLVTEPQLFGEHVLQQRRREKQQDNAAELVVKSLTELNIGSPVVHIDHGAGRYLGLETLDILDQETEFLCLSYQDEAKLYVPVASLHLISRYGGSDEKLAPLHRLGSDVWEKAKRKAAEQIRDVAAELLNIYARREAKKGHAYPQPDEAYFQFSAAFPFEETVDQQNAIQRVISDMVQNKAMDHLICGDVGFGKTEVAMRATFLAIQSGKQVAILVPTTLLAQQHESTFKDRFADWPVNIESISRFKSKKQQKLIFEKMAEGNVDIVIGTHGLIQDQVNFKNLGLVIIDEEHRFGVRQKEKLKSLRSEVDILTMTATPIPRTLNMAMSGMRDLTIIATPPAKRLSIKTFIRQHNDGLIKEAIQRELMRGGQVYYLHNEVKDIESTAHQIQTLVPEARISIGHGQMRERELEQVMSDFYHKRTNLLVCTTIIETGIDIPNANTIIIDRADKFGLAQIHQLRGRVGRSHHQAYAYLLTPHPKAMTSDAVKRLDAINEAQELGSGFILASHDLEIRGAGELLGDEQTGNMQTIGFSLFMEMLDQAVKAIKEGKTPNLDRPLKDDTEVNLRLPALIPEAYLPDVHSRLVLYKRISNAEQSAQLKSLQVEMIDRFGLLPEPVKSLFRITQLKLAAESLGIKKIDVGENNGKFEFSQDTSIDPFLIVKLVQADPQRYRLATQNQLTFTENMHEPETRFQKTEQLLERLAVPAT
ncbi:MAG: transcription-repair coupling factor [Pseudomonadales bacterium]|nr:transcription-repair coupling factor [Pseudomonadales bacterium]